MMTMEPPPLSAFLKIIFLFVVKLSTMPCRNIGTNDKVFRKVALLRYTERLNFTSQNLNYASKQKPQQRLGARLPSS